MWGPRLDRLTFLFPEDSGMHQANIERYHHFARKDLSKRKRIGFVPFSTTEEAIGG
jgi:hypothetical protein